MGGFPGVSQVTNRLTDRIARVALFAGAAIFPALWSSSAHGIFVRHDLAQSGTPGVGLDDYETVATAYPATGYFWNAALPGEWCTGTIVNYTKQTTRVLTAAHCIAGFDLNNDKVVSAAEGANLTFQLGAVGHNAGQKTVLNGAGSALKLGWYPNTFTGVNNPDDVAVVEINANSVAFNNTTPAAFSYTTAANVLGRQADFVGWGNQGTGDANANAGNAPFGPARCQVVTDSPSSVQDNCLNFAVNYKADDKLGAQNIIDSNFNGMIITDFDKFDGTGANPFNSAFGLNFEGTTAQGDSGGPIIPVSGPGAGTIVGVLSAGISAPNIPADANPSRCKTNSLYDDCSSWAPLAPNMAFLQEHIIPEPSTLFLLGASLMGVIAYGRRRSRTTRG